MRGARRGGMSSSHMGIVQRRRVVRCDVVPVLFNLLC